MEKQQSFDVAKSLASARASYTSGALDNYMPLGGTNYQFFVKMTSWGPLMKR